MLNLTESRVCVTRSLVGLMYSSGNLSALKTWMLCDLDLDLMTLTYELDVDILKMYLHTKNNDPIGQGYRKLKHDRTHYLTQKERERERCDGARYHATSPHWRMIKTWSPCRATVDILRTWYVRPLAVWCCLSIFVIIKLWLMEGYSGWYNMAVCRVGLKIQRNNATRTWHIQLQRDQVVNSVQARYLWSPADHVPLYFRCCCSTIQIPIQCRVCIVLQMAKRCTRLREIRCQVTSSKLTL